MKNWEKYEKEIAEMKYEFVVTTSGRIARCSEIGCVDCMGDSIDENCNAVLIRWLYQDYKEPRKLTKKQRLFCEMMESGWLAREENGSLYWYRYKPAKLNSVWDSRAAAFRHITITNIVDFPFIKWEDEEPYSIEEMLTWEVEE